MTQKLEKMSRSTFNAIHPDFRHIMADGTPVVMRVDPKTGGSMLVPVEVVEYQFCTADLLVAWGPFEMSH